MFFLIAWADGMVFSRVSAQQTGPAILSPQAGQAFQGIVTITGTSTMDGFVSADISFAYANDPTDTWFQLAVSSQPIENGTLATWDTTAITDGTYVLRLRVFLTDGSHLDAIVADLRVRNYTPIETAMPTNTAAPTATLPVLTPLPTATSTAVPFPTPTALSRNPAAIAKADVYISIICGGVTAALILVFLRIYLLSRRR